MGDPNTEVSATSDDLESIIAQHWDDAAGSEEKAVEEKVEETTEETTAEAETEEAPAEEEKPVAKEEVKAPQSWTPAAREQFANLPAEVQAEITRRENEMGTKHREAAQYKQYVDTIAESITPYKEYIADRGGDPLKAMGELFATATALQKGTQRQKAEAMAGLFTEFGVDVNELDAVLSEVLQKPQPSATERAILEKLNKLEQVAQPRPQQTTPQNTAAEITAFANDPANEFFMDVKNDMALLMQSGRTNSLKDAYNIAVRMNDQISKIISDRAVKSAQKQDERLKAGKQSIKGKAPASSAPKVKTGDQSLWEAIDSHWE